MATFGKTGGGGSRKSSGARSTGATQSRKSGAGKRARTQVALADEDKRFMSESMHDAEGRGLGETEGGVSGVLEALERFGMSSDRVQRLRTVIEDIDVRQQIEKASDYLSEQIESARDYARENPKKVIGGAAGVLVGASLLAIALRRASGDEKRGKRSASSRSAPSRSSSSGSRSGGSSSKSRSSSAGSKRSGSKKSRSR